MFTLHLPATLVNKEYFAAACVWNETLFQIKIFIFQRNGCKEFWAAQWNNLTAWLLDVEMGFVWGVASLSIISFIFASIWYIDPALLTMVLQFQAADCTTVKRWVLAKLSQCLKFIIDNSSPPLCIWLLKLEKKGALFFLYKMLLQLLHCIISTVSCKSRFYDSPPALTPTDLNRFYGAKLSLNNFTPSLSWDLLPGAQLWNFS